MNADSLEPVGRDLIPFEKYSINATKTSRGSSANKSRPSERKNCNDWRKISNLLKLIFILFIFFTYFHFDRRNCWCQYFICILFIIHFVGGKVICFWKINIEWNIRLQANFHEKKTLLQCSQCEGTIYYTYPIVVNSCCRL